MNEFEEVTSTNTEEQEDNFNELFLLALALLLNLLLTLVKLPTNLSSQQLLLEQTKMFKEVDKIFSDLEIKATKLSSEMITNKYVEGVNNSRKTTGLSDTELMAKDLNISHRRLLEELLTQNNSDILKATTHVKENIKELVRKLVSVEMTKLGETQSIPSEAIRNERLNKGMRENLIKEGFKDVDVAIIDKLGRKWKLNTYTKMLVRTQLNFAYNEAVRKEGATNGFDLALITKNPTTEDECLYFEHMVISLNGLTRGYPTYDEIKASKKCFHPNCRHHLIAVRNIEDLPANIRIAQTSLLAVYRRIK